MYSRPDWFTSNVSDFQVMSWGFTFSGRDHMTSFLNSEIFEGMSQKVVLISGAKV